MTWWQALTILIQGVSAGAPMWVLLWAVDRLSAGGRDDSRRMTLSNLREACEAGNTFEVGADVFAVGMYNLIAGPDGGVTGDAIVAIGAMEALRAAMGYRMLAGFSLGPYDFSAEVRGIRIDRDDGLIEVSFCAYGPLHRRAS
jgi:hypothetical protein